MNLMDYLDWRGDLTFEQDSFNAVDALILSNIIYMKIDGLMENSFDFSMTFEQLNQKLNNSPDLEERKQLGVGINPKTYDLFCKTANSSRFKNVVLSGLRTIFDEEKIEQFAAVTFIIDDCAVIAYRGTDDTIIGWEEDFNLSYMEHIPSQTDALLYFNEVCKFYHKKSIIMLGHSKGGNLSIYTASHALPKFQRRIRTVYNFDGPGFVQEFFESSNYKRIEHKLQNFYPEDDFVGMLLRHPQNFQIIKSDSKGLGQHDPLKWHCLGNKLVICPEGFSDLSQIFYRAINELALKVSNDEKKKIVEGFFSVYEASGCKTNYELSKNIPMSAKNMIKAFSELDKTTKSEIHRLISLFRKCIKSEIPLFNILPNLKFDTILKNKEIDLELPDVLADEGEV